MGAGSNHAKTMRTVTHEESIDVVAGQAVLDCDELDSGASVEPLGFEEQKLTRMSAERIKELKPRRAYFSHDPRVWPAR